MSGMRVYSISTLVIFNLHHFARPPQGFGQILQQADLDAQVHRQLGVLVGGIDRLANKQVQVGAAFQQDMGDLGRSVRLIQLLEGIGVGGIGQEAGDKGRWPAAG